MMTTNRTNQRRRLALLLAAGAALALATTALAGSGVGSVFNLGQPNTVNGTSSLMGATSGPQLKVTNTNSAYQAITAVAGSGSGIALYGVHPGSSGAGAAVQGQTASSGGAGVLGKNTAGGPGLQADVTSNSVPPLKVNSTAKVANLNADRLDGFDSMGFLKNTVPLSLSGTTASDGVIVGKNLGSANGVQGVTNTPAASGVYGENNGGGAGIAGRSNEAGGTGVYGEATGAGGLAGKFLGDVSVSGELKVGGAQVVTGGKLLRNAVALGPNNCCNFTVLEDPGYWRIGYLCPDPLTNLGVITIGNKSSEAMNVFVDNGGSNPEYVQLAASDRADRGANPSGEWYTIQMHSSKGITQISVFSVNRASDCHIQAQAIETP
jgi:hypothetical protein